MRVPFLIVFAVCRYFQISMSIELDCHKEQKFVKAEQDGLPAVNAIQVMTTSNVEFCTIKCLDYSGCKSIVLLLLNSDDNCLLSDEINGAQSSSASVTYIKTSHVTTVCVTNICEHGSTCTDVCTPPYYHCSCLPSYFEGEHCEQNSKCEKVLPCQNSGTCSSSQVNPFYTCSCPTYFTGTNCEINTRCNYNPCYNGGYCYTQSTSPYYYCSCPWPFSGSTCATNTKTNDEMIMSSFTTRPWTVAIDQQMTFKRQDIYNKRCDATVKTGALALLKRLVHTSHVHVHLVAGEMSVKKIY